MLSLEPERIQKAELLIKTWDGGEGSIRDPFTLNDRPYKVISGKAIHDVVFTRVNVPADHLRRGRNRVRLVSDTDHHGIEVLLPGPCLILRYR
jgi:hypothetical protein